MKKTLLIFASSLLILGCNTKSQKAESTESSDISSAVVEEPIQAKTNYAVVWKWATTDTKLVEDNLPAISEELTALWKSGVVGNVYFNTGGPEGKLGNFPNIAYFMQASSETDAKSILDKLIVVKKGIADYDLHAVGTLWLERKTDVINAKGITSTFVTVWTRSETLRPSDEQILEQNNRILELWNEGTIENVYFDIEGTQEKNAKTDFVFFVNTNSQEEAEAICNALPFTEEGFASYKIYPSGTFWMRQQ